MAQEKIFFFSFKRKTQFLIKGAGMTGDVCRSYDQLYKSSALAGGKDTEA